MSLRLTRRATCVWLGTSTTTTASNWSTNPVSDQQRYHRNHDLICCGLRDELRSPPPDQGVDDRMEVGAGGGVREDDIAQRLAIQTAGLRQNLFSEPRHHLGQAGVPGSTTSRASWSESISSTPCSASRLATVVLPSCGGRKGRGCAV